MFRHQDISLPCSSQNVSNQLPYVNLSASDVEKYPDFCSLLSILSTQITPDGLSLQTTKDLKQAEEVLRHEKHAWLLNLILYTELQELALDYDIKSQEVSLSSRDAQFHKILQGSLTHAEISDYLEFSPDPSSKVTSLGLSRDDLNWHNPCRQHLSSLQQALIPEVEERLRKKCENLVLAHDPLSANTSESTNLMFAKSSQLPVLVERDIHQLEESHRRLKEDQRKKEKQFTAYYQVLLDSLHLMQSLISKYKLGQQLEKDTITAEWLYAKCDAMCLKIKIVELQILCDTYTIETLDSLRIIRKKLEEAHKDSEKEKVHVEQAIKAYECLGQEFDQIVSEFGKFKDELENKQWALAEFGKTQSGATGSMTG